MAALSITAANVRQYGTVAQGVAGGTLTQGLAVRLDSNGQIIAATNTSAANAAACGIALDAASANQPCHYLIGGLIDLGATIAVGKVYVLGTSGGIIPVDDIAGSEFITVLGVGITASRFQFGLNVSGVAAAGGVS